MNDEQLGKDAAFYFTVCLLKKLLQAGEISAGEYMKICQISREYYGSSLRFF
jgi:hypothetical protein